MIIKVLSANDVGSTNAHQAGIHIPKLKVLLSYFPTLDNKIKNPRAEISFTDSAGDKWKFQFIYYNNKLFGGTRNEYRLTCMTKFLKVLNLREGDKLQFYMKEGKYMISHERKELKLNDAYIKLSDSWITVNINKL